MTEGHDERDGDGDETLELLLQARDGDVSALERVFGRHRDELRRVVARRLEPELRGRFDPSDVVQEAQIEALERLPDFVGRRPMPFRDWLFRTAFQRLSKLRQHAQAARRDVGREREPVYGDDAGGGECRPMAADGPTPSEHLAERERCSRLTCLLGRLSDPDRTILELRVFEGLSYEEVGDRLAIEPAAARKRYGRALLRLRVLLLAEGLTESRL